MFCLHKTLMLALFVSARSALWNAFASPWCWLPLRARFKLVVFLGIFDFTYLLCASLLSDTVQYTSRQPSLSQQVQNPEEAVLDRLPWLTLALWHWIYCLTHVASQKKQQHSQRFGDSYPVSVHWTWYWNWPVTRDRWVTSSCRFFPGWMQAQSLYCHTECTMR